MKGDLSEQHGSYNDCIKTFGMYGHTFKSPAEKRKTDNEAGCMCSVYVWQEGLFISVACISGADRPIHVLLCRDGRIPTGPGQSGHAEAVNPLNTCIHAHLFIRFPLWFCILRGALYSYCKHKTGMQEHFNSWVSSFKPARKDKRTFSLKYVSSPHLFFCSCCLKLLCS